MAEVKAVAFKCQSDPGEPSPTHILTEELCRKANVRYEDVFTDAASMARMAKTIRREDGDVICRLPFSVAAEAEQLGAAFAPNPENRLPAVKNPPYAKLDEIGELPPFDFAKGQMAAALAAAETLSREGETVLLEMEGVFSIMGMLAPSKELYKGLYRKRDKIRDIAARLREHVVAYAREAVRHGVKIVAYSDATISFDLVSPDSYKNICGAVTLDVVRAIREAVPDTLLHLCSATSVGIERAGLCRSEAIPVPEGATYGEALLFALKNPDIKIVGHGCHGRTQYRLEEPKIYKIDMDNI
ncbi:MAG: hypothetical protein IJS96_02210 [Schwartzia sp.]|nr:hypothetical protein [Schwartzia sp. (in: firmicutes)]